MLYVMNRIYKRTESLSLFPDKVFYKIGEVSKILEVEPYTIRYWESEFLFIQPKRTKTGQRIYTKEDIDLLKEIKRLLYEEKYTISGVKKKFTKNNLKSESTKNGETLTSPFVTSEEYNEKELVKVLSHIKKKLKEILASL